MRRIALRSAGVLRRLGAVNCVRHSLFLDLVSKMARVNRSQAYYANGVRGRASRDMFYGSSSGDASFGTRGYNCAGTAISSRAAYRARTKKIDPAKTRWIDFQIARMMQGKLCIGTVAPRMTDCEFLHAIHSHQYPAR